MHWSKRSDKANWSVSSVITSIAVVLILNCWCWHRRLQSICPGHRMIHTEIYLLNMIITPLDWFTRYSFAIRYLFVLSIRVIHLVYTRYPFGIYVLSIWYIRVIRLVYTCYPFGIYVLFVWYIRVIHLVYTCNPLVYTCNPLVYTRYPFGMIMIILRDQQTRLWCLWCLHSGAAHSKEFNSVC